MNMKLSIRGVLFSVVFTSLLLLYMHMTAADQKQTDPPSDSFATRTSIQLWNHFFEQHVRPGDEADKIKELLVRKALDWGRSSSGGSGNYLLCFKLDDFMQAQFQFDHSNRLESYKVLKGRALWIKDPDGNILYQSRQ